MNTSNRGFALPTVLISSIIMMMVLLSGLTALASVNTSIRTQYSESITDQAAESGLAFARGCIAQSGNTITWSNAQPLRPNTDCNGVATTSCPNTSTDNACYVLNATNYRTSFEVGVITDGSNKPTSINSKGISRNVRSTNGSVAKDSVSIIKTTVGSVGVPSTNAGNRPVVTSGSNGAGTSCAVADGRVYCWGASQRREAGSYPSECTPYLNTVGIAEPCAVPTSIIPAGKTVVSVSLSSYGNTSGTNGHACAVTSDGSLYCWGNNYYYETGGHNNAGGVKW
jgi:Tfp pilus assembly protein PilX